MGNQSSIVPPNQRRPRRRFRRRLIGPQDFDVDDVSQPATQHQGLIPNQNFAAFTSSLPKRPTKVRCFSCKSILLVPDGNISVFGCPCGQKLTLRRPEDAEVNDADTRVRCPRCFELTAVPEGAVVFPCTCGLHLKRPSKQDKRPISIKDTTINVDDAEHVKKPGSTWKRTLVTSEKMGWRRIWDELEESNVARDETRIMQSIEVLLDEMSAQDAIARLRRCLLEVSDHYTKEELQTRAKNAVEEICSLVRSCDLKRCLEDRLLDYSSLRTKRDLAVRLFCFEWSNGRSCAECVDRSTDHGMVRSFRVHSNDLGKLELEFVPAYDFLVTTRTGLETLSEPPLIGGEELMTVHGSFPFEEKVDWFQQKIANQIRLPWEEGHVRVRVRRDHILEDSLGAISKLNSVDMRRYFRFEFIGEPGQDAGGVAREWFNLVFRQLFEKNLKLFERQTNGCYGICPVRSDESDRLKLMRFAGRIVGRAIFEGHNAEFSFTQIIYKHMLGCVLLEDDLIYFNEQVMQSTKALWECNDIASLSLDFTLDGEELKPGGSEIEVTNENKAEYLALRMQHLLLNRISGPLKEFLFGLYETVPLALLSVFDPSEVDLLLGGLPEIDVADWKRNTVYRGEYAADGPDHPTITWFWELLEEADREERAKFLQFSTGTTRVPIQGFVALQGNDGNVKLFTIESVALETSVFPRAHTCFNRIDLPMYRDKEEMKCKCGHGIDCTRLVRTRQLT